MMRDYLAQQKLNIEHTIRPQPGDYWQDMCSPCFLVVWSDGEYMEYLDTDVHRKRIGDYNWTWDTTKPPLRCRIEEFAKQLRYETIPDSCWADVMPDHPAHRFAVPLALQARKKVAP